MWFNKRYICLQCGFEDEGNFCKECGSDVHITNDELQS
jgi:rRNA maturation endonuclease Nob1